MQVCSPGHPFYSHHIVDRAKCKSVLPDSRFIPIHMELDVRLPAPSPPSTRYTHIIMVLDAQCLVLLASRRSRDSKWLAEKIEFLYGGGQLINSTTRLTSSFIHIVMVLDAQCQSPPPPSPAPQYPIYPHFFEGKSKLQVYSPLMPCACNSHRLDGVCKMQVCVT